MYDLAGEPSWIIAGFFSFSLEARCPAKTAGLSNNRANKIFIVGYPPAGSTGRGSISPADRNQNVVPQAFRDGTLTIQIFGDATGFSPSLLLPDRMDYFLLERVISEEGPAICYSVLLQRARGSNGGGKSAGQAQIVDRARWQWSQPTDLDRAGDEEQGPPTPVSRIRL
jgi:hypothetical protein